LNDVVSGDFNQDGRKDLASFETAKNNLDLVIFDSPASWCRPTMQSSRSDLSAPGPGTKPSLAKR